MSLKMKIKKYDASLQKYSSRISMLYAQEICRNSLHALLCQKCKSVFNKDCFSEINFLVL